MRRESIDEALRKRLKAVRSMVQRARMMGADLVGRAIEREDVQLGVALGLR